VDFARESGDLSALSKVDIQVLALSYMLERQECAGDLDHLRLKPVQRPRIGPKASQPSSSVGPGAGEAGAEAAPPVPGVLPEGVIADDEDSGIGGSNEDDSQSSEEETEGGEEGQFSDAEENDNSPVRKTSIGEISLADRESAEGDYFNDRDSLSGSGISLADNESVEGDYFGEEDARAAVAELVLVTGSEARQDKSDGKCPSRRASGSLIPPPECWI